MNSLPAKALVVDNNPVLLRAVSALLQKEGCLVKEAENGLDAVKLLKQYSPDIIFTDLVMPLVGGEQLCQIIRHSEQLRKAFIVIVTAINPEDIPNIIDGRFFDYCIVKSGLKELKLHIQEALQQFNRYCDGELHSQNYASSEVFQEQNHVSLSSELLSEKLHLNRILDNLEEGIVQLDRQGLVVSLNRAALNILDQQPEHLIGRSFASYSWGTHQDIISSWLKRIAAGDESQSLEIGEEAPLKLDGKIVTASLQPVGDESGVFSLCILHDITRQYLAEQYEREMDNAIKLVTKMEAMSCMAGGIAHDFNNLLTVICGNLDILAHTGGSGDNVEIGSLIEHARTASYMAVDLTRKISSSSPFGIVSRKNHVFEEVVEEAVVNFFASGQESYQLQMKGTGSIVSIDRQQITTALENILQNGIEADEAGEVIITTSDVEYSSPEIIAGQYVPSGAYACVSIEDNGCGIEQEQLLKIFDPYYSTKVRGAEKGMGLGLTVVYSTLRNHGGYVVVNSESGVGTTVSCYLPRYGSKTTAKKREDQAGMAKKCVVLVEKDRAMQQVSRIMLDYLDHEVTVVETVKDALNSIGTLSSSEEKGGRLAVIVDPQQCLVQDHEGLCLEFRKLHPAITIIVTGESALAPELRFCKKYGYDNALPKPFTLDNLKHVLNRAEQIEGG